MQDIPHDDSRLQWPGAVSLETTPEFTCPWRLVHSRKDWFPVDLHTAAQRPAGVRLSFLSDTRSLGGRIVPAETEGGLDLFVDGEKFQFFELNNQSDSFRFDDLPEGEKHLELWLPPNRSFILRGLQIDRGATLRKAPADDRPRWITYGSSITHCGGALSPSQTWPAIAARHFGWNLTSLGYGGQCHLDIAIARMIRDLPADRISICAGINIYGAPTLGPRMFRSNLMGTVELIREKHPETPILLISPIISPPREQVANSQGWTLADYRSVVAEVAALIRDQGDAPLEYLNGLDLFGEDCVSLLPDELHPSGDGYVRMGENFIRKAPKSWVEG